MRIYILCFNEEIMIERTINHYKKKFPSAKIIILDNYSTDASRDIATENGCEVRFIDTQGSQDEVILKNIRNTIWDEVEEGWVIMCDMDEWLDADEEDLAREEAQGVNVLEVRGYDMVGDSTTIALSDIDLDTVQRGVYKQNMSKRVCFRRPDIQSMRYGIGMHTNDPLVAPGHTLKFSTRQYVLRHMYYLGLNYLIDKHRRRYERNELARRLGFYNGHYTLDIKQLRSFYNDHVSRAIDIGLYHRAD